MWPGHAAGDGVDGVPHLDALGLEQVRELAHVVLRLRDRETVAGHDDHALRVAEEDRRILGAHLAERAAVVRLRARGGRGRRSERAEEDVGQRPVHRLRHEAGEDRARGADERAGDDEHLVPDREAGHRDREPGVRVEERDDDRHVRSADRHDERDAEREREQRDQREHEPRRYLDHPRRVGHQGEREEDHAGEEAAGDELLARVLEGLRVDEPLQLAERDDAAGERDRADHQAEEDRDDLARRDSSPAPSACMYSRIETSAAAPPPAPLKMATICGIAVIGT